MGHGTLIPTLSTAGHQGCGLTGKTSATATGLTVGTAGYQECGLVGKAGSDETGLAGTTTYWFKVALNGGTAAERSITTVANTTFTGVIALLNAAMTGSLAGVVWGITGGDLRCTSPTSGTASVVQLSAGTTGTDLLANITGLSLDAHVHGTTTTYYLKVTKDSGSQTEVSINTGLDVTFAGVIPLLNAAMVGALAGCVWSLYGGDLRCTSPTAGPNSRISLAAGTSGTDFFVTLTGFAAFTNIVPGVLNLPDVTERYVTYYGGFTVSAAADTYETGGITTSFAGIVPHNAPPVWVNVMSRGPSSGTLANVYSFVPGTTIANGKTLVFVTLGTAAGIKALQENTDALAYSDSKVRIDLDTIVFKATWRKGS